MQPYNKHMRVTNKEVVLFTADLDSIPQYLINPPNIAKNDTYAQNW